MTCFDYDDKLKEYTDEDEFYVYASIGGELLKDIWYDVKNAD